MTELIILGLLLLVFLVLLWKAESSTFEGDDPERYAQPHEYEELGADYPPHPYRDDEKQ